eukprot:14444121-Alexandrium_andersonii.AAC.1
MDLRKTAEEAAIGEIYRTGEIRAKNSQARRRLVFRPGDLVYYWRQGRQKGPAHNKRGRFLGPAKVLVTEAERT